MGNKQRFGALVLIISAGCGQGSTTTNPPPTGSSSSAITGQVTSAPSGTSVSASRVESSGQLTALAGGPVTVDSSGHYSLPVTQSDVDGHAVVVSATSSGSAVGSVSTDGKFDASGDIKPPPIDARSTVETDVMVSATVMGEWSSDASLDELRVLLTPSLATSIHASASYDADVKVTAQAMTAAMDARAAMLRAKGVTQTQLDAAATSTATAAAAFDTSLDAATSDADVESAFSVYASAHAQAALDLGVTADQMAAATIAESGAVHVYLAQLSANVQGALRSNAAQLDAQATSASIAAQFAAVGATADVKQAVATASASLTSSLSTSAAGSSSLTTMQITQAWVAYQAAINAQLVAALGAPVTTWLGGNAAATSTVTVAVGGLVGAQAMLSATAAAQATAQGEVTALMQFATSVQKDEQALMTLGLSQANADAVLDVETSIDAAANGS